MKLPCWLWHDYEVLHREELKNHPDHWFEHLKCRKCGIDILYSHVPFFGSFSLAVALGILEGFYTSLHPEIRRFER